MNGDRLPNPSPPSSSEDIRKVAKTAVKVIAFIAVIIVTILVIVHFIYNTAPNMNGTWRTANNFAPETIVISGNSIEWETYAFLSTKPVTYTGTFTMEPAIRHPNSKLNPRFYFNIRLSNGEIVRGMYEHGIKTLQIAGSYFTK